MQQGHITGEIKEHFPAERIADPDNFVSLLYYFGMITFAGTHRGNTRFVILNYRLKQAAVLLKQSADRTIAEVSDCCGFSTPVYFSQCFKKQYGVTPQAYRKSQTGGEKG